MLFGCSSIYVTVRFSVLYPLLGGPIVITAVFFITLPNVHGEVARSGVLRLRGRVHEQVSRCAARIAGICGQSNEHGMGMNTELRSGVGTTNPLGRTGSWQHCIAAGDGC